MRCRETLNINVSIPHSLSHHQAHLFGDCRGIKKVLKASRTLTNPRATTQPAGSGGSSVRLNHTSEPSRILISNQTTRHHDESPAARAASTTGELTLLQTMCDHPEHTEQETSILVPQVTAKIDHQT